MKHEAGQKTHSDVRGRLCGVVVWLLSFRTQDGKVSEMVYCMYRLYLQVFHRLFCDFEYAYSPDLSNSALPSTRQIQALLWSTGKAANL